MALSTKSLPTTRSITTSLRPASRIQGQPYGAGQAPQDTKSLGQSSASLHQSGPIQAQEQFNHPGLPLEISRALNTLQTNIQAATAQAKADPTANKNVVEQVAISNGGPGGSKPNAISHGLGAAYRDYRICSVRNGYITGHAAIAPTTGQPANAVLLLWTQVVAFGASPVTATIEIWS